MCFNLFTRNHKKFYCYFSKKIIYNTFIPMRVKFSEHSEVSFKDNLIAASRVCYFKIVLYSINDKC